jgi:hypothetical protein
LYYLPVFGQKNDQNDSLENATLNFSGLANVVVGVANSATGKIISSGGGPTTFLRWLAGVSGDAGPHRKSQQLSTP